jgi:hypothetical protein
MRPIAADRLIRAGVAATLTVQFADSDGEPAVPAGTVTIGITKADGSTLVASGTATVTPTDTTTRTYALAAVNTLELLTVTWTDGGDGSTHTQLVEVVGGYYFSVTQARQRDTSLADPAEYPSSAIIRARREVEEQCEAITGVAWVPRFRRVRVDGTGTGAIVLPDPMLRTVRSVRTYSTGTAFTAWPAGDVTGITIGDSDMARAGVAQRADGGYWPWGVQNMVVEYEHGFDRPPADLIKAAIIHCRHQLNENVRSGLLDRATSFQPVDGGNVMLATPGRFGFETGIPYVDAVYQRYSMTVPGIA